MIFYIFILDCEGGFNFKRLRQIADKVIREEVEGKITVVQCMERIFYKRILDYFDLEQALLGLEDTLKKKPKVKN